MAIISENESWIVDIGYEIMKKKKLQGKDSLLPWELLTNYFWVADYGMKNAGNIEAAYELDPEFHSEGKRLAEKLNLPLTLEAFSLSKEELEKQYFERFEQICNELKLAAPEEAVKVKPPKVRKLKDSKVEKL